VLANGCKLAEGKANEIRNDPDVIAAYLGRPVKVTKVDA
jgi:ABC-type branched-subunit amino acid transport system ATPase component